MSSTVTETPMSGPQYEREAASNQTALSAKAPTPAKRAWGVSPYIMDNSKLRSLAIDVAVITTTWAINQAETTRRTYDYLNAHYDPWLWTSLAGFAITTVVYWIYGALYAIVDLTGRPKILARYKRVTAAQYKQICAIVLRNQLLVSLPVTVVLSGPIARWRGMSSLSQDLPGFWRTLGTWAFCLLCEEVGFYYVHRFLHEPSRYAKYHKQHHTFTAPCALAATYCTMTEHIFSNLLPILSGLIVLGSHWSMVVFFFCSLELGTLNTHSGYCIPGLHRSLQHDFHHFAFNENFGPTGLLDKWHGTNKKFEAALAQAMDVCQNNRAAAEMKILSDLAAAGY